MITCANAFVRFLARQMPSWCAHFGDPCILGRWAWIGKRCKSASCCTLGELGRIPSHVRVRHPAVAERMIDGLQANAPLRCSSQSDSAGKLFWMDWRCHHGRSLLTAHHPVQRSQSPHNSVWDGNSGPPGSWRRSFCGRRCGLASVTVPEHCCVPNTDLWLLRY